MSETKEVDSGEILKTLVKQGAFKAAREYVVFLENEADARLTRIPPQSDAPVEAGAGT